MNRRNRERKNYLLKYHQRTRYVLVDGDINCINSSKKHQYEIFGDMLGREWISVDDVSVEQLEAFIKKQGRVILKPEYGSQGKGVFAISAEEIEENLLDTYAEIAGKRYLCEGYIVQHPALAKINPSSVNTIRIFTLNDGKSVRITSAAIRTGGKGSVCDNMSAGGVGAAIDIDSGVVCTNGVDFEKRAYVWHPASGVQLIGIQIPFWTEITDMVKQAALRVGETPICGWDIAVTENGPLLIELNNRPAGRLAQIAMGKPCGKEILEFLKASKKNYRKLGAKTRRAYKKYK